MSNPSFSFLNSKDIILEEIIFFLIIWLIKFASYFLSFFYFIPIIKPYNELLIYFVSFSILNSKLGKEVYIFSSTSLILENKYNFSLQIIFFESNFLVLFIDVTLIKEYYLSYL
jgi:hypothetical protein